MNHSFNISVATKLWMQKAVILENIIFRRKKDCANNHNLYDGKHWIYNSARAFAVLFPYLNNKSIQRRLQELVVEWFLLKWVYNKSKFDKTARYSPTEKLLDMYWIYWVEQSTTQNEQPMDQGRQSMDQDEETIPVIITDIITNKKHINKNSYQHSLNPIDSIIVTPLSSAPPPHDTIHVVDKKAKEVKNKYWEFMHVQLTEKQYEDLELGFGPRLKNLIETLDIYIWSKWDKYKNHYFTILSRARKSGIKRSTLPINTVADERIDSGEDSLC